MPTANTTAPRYSSRVERLGHCVNPSPNSFTHPPATSLNYFGHPSSPRKTSASCSQRGVRSGACMYLHPSSSLAPHRSVLYSLLPPLEGRPGGIELSEGLGGVGERPWLLGRRALQEV